MKQGDGKTVIGPRRVGGALELVVTRASEEATFERNPE